MNNNILKELRSEKREALITMLVSMFFLGVVIGAAIMRYFPSYLHWLW